MTGDKYLLVQHLDTNTKAEMEGMLDGPGTPGGQDRDPRGAPQIGSFP